MTTIYLDSIVNQEDKCSCGHKAKEHYDFGRTRYDLLVMTESTGYRYGPCLAKEEGNYCKCEYFMEEKCRNT